MRVAGRYGRVGVFRLDLDRLLVKSVWQTESRANGRSRGSRDRGQGVDDLVGLPNGRTSAGERHLLSGVTDRVSPGLASERAGHLPLNHKTPPGFPLGGVGAAALNVGGLGYTSTCNPCRVIPWRLRLLPPSRTNAAAARPIYFTAAGTATFPAAMAVATSLASWGHPDDDAPA